MRVRQYEEPPLSRNMNMRLKGEKSDLPQNLTDGSIDYSKIKVDGIKNLEDAIIDFPLKKVNRNYTDKEFVLKSLYHGDAKTLKSISQFFYRTSGIYNRLCRYMAYLYRYDWFITPYINNVSGLI